MLIGKKREREKNNFAVCFIRLGILFFCIFYLNACSDFASIFNKDQRTRNQKGSSEGRKTAARKDRKGSGKVVTGVFVWPLEGEVSSGFGERDGRPHDGIDIRAEKGTSIHATAAGEVVFSGVLKGYGNLVLVKHKDNYFTAYAHNSENEVKEGKSVEQGEEIAKVGDTGHATGYHLHFEIRYKSSPMDPLQFLPEAPEASVIGRR